MRDTTQVQIPVIRLAPGAVVYELAARDADQSDDLVGVSKRVGERQVRPEAVSTDDATPCSVRAPNGLGVVDQGLHGVVAIPVRAPAAPRLEPDDPADILDHAGEGSEVVIAARTAVEHEERRAFAA